MQYKLSLLFSKANSKMFNSHDRIKMLCDDINGENLVLIDE